MLILWLSISVYALSCSFSDTDINSCEEYLSGAAGNQSCFLSQATSTESHLPSDNSVAGSRFGSDTALELFTRAEQIKARLGQLVEASQDSAEQEEEGWEEEVCQFIFLAVS